MFQQRLDDDASMLQQGIKQVPGTDGGWYATPFGRYHLVPELMVGRTGMTPREAWEACTHVAATSVGLERETGAIEVGKRADLVALAADPTEDVKAFKCVRWTMVGGRVLYDRLGV
jgi:imidazolonepropionase-like amidohydrolase